MFVCDDLALCSVGEAVNKLGPTLALYENVMSATQRSKGPNGQVHRPAIEAGAKRLK